MFGRNKGRPTAVDFAILILILAVLTYLIAFAPGPREYSGSEIYTAIIKYGKLNAKGYDIEVEVSGRETGTLKPVVVKGRMVRIGKGSFVIESGGEKYSVGGSMASAEDIAADLIRFNLLTPDVVYFGIGEQEFDSFSDLCTDIRRMTDESVTLPYGSVKFEGMVAANIDLDPVTQLKIMNEMTLLPEDELFVYSNGVRMDSEAISLDEICEVGEILEEEYKSSKGVTSELVLKVGLVDRIETKKAYDLKDSLPDYAIKSSFRVVSED